MNWVDYVVPVKSISEKRFKSFTENVNPCTGEIKC